MKPTAWANSCKAALAPSRGPTTKAAAFKGRYSDRISCIPGTNSSHCIINKWLRIADLSTEQWCVGFEQRHDPIDDHPHFARMALILVRHQPLFLQQIID